MKRILAMIICVCVLLGLCACGGSETDNEKIESFSVGFAKADITPDGSVPLRGGYDERFSNQVMDRLMATCVAFADTEGNKLLWFAIDIGVCPGKIIEPVRKRISEETGVPFSHVMFSADHTHSAPNNSKTANPSIADANRKLSDNCLQAAKEALADLKPAQMYGTFTRPEGLNYVRHYVMTDGTYKAKDVGLHSQKEIYGHMWKADNLFQMVKFVREGGKDVVLVNWQSHYWGATKINNYGISADFYGVLRNELEAAMDCHVSFILGGSGNLAASSYIAGETAAKDYIEHGKLLAAEALKVKDTFQPLETGTIILKEHMYVAEGTLKENPLYTFGFGDFGAALAPFEIFDNHARGVREASMYKYTFYASCSNDSSGYLPNEASFNYYCYEAGDTKYPKGTGEAIQAKLTEMINDCFNQSAQTVKERPEGYVTAPFEPYTDDVEYINPHLGDTSKLVQTANGHYPLMLATDNSIKNLVIDNLELAEKIINTPTMKLLFDDRNIVVGIVE
jgi:hypothetical protein